MKRNALVVLGVLGIAAVVMWLARGHEPSSDVAEATPAPIEMTPQADAPSRADAGRAELDPFDCTAPTGAAAHVDGEPIAARELCTAWQRIAGAAELRGVDALEAQRKALLEAMIDARLVHRALAKAGNEVTEGEVDTAFDALVAQQKAASRAAYEQALRAQGMDVEDVRAELRRRLERERLVEQGKPTDPQQLLAALRAQAKIEYRR
jgi:hypothetical protein